MANYLSDRTGASIDAVLDNADAGNIGKGSLSISSDLNNETLSGFYAFSNTTGNTPSGSDNGVLIVGARDSGTGLVRNGQVSIDNGGRMHFRRKTSTAWQPWKEIYNTGNTLLCDFNGTNTDVGTNRVGLAPLGSLARIIIENAGTASNLSIAFKNANSDVGGITTSGSATAYNTSSDPRLKDFAEAPTDEAINEEFNKMFSCFRTFKWKTDPEGALVWGFDAHACIDAGTGIGSEGEGPRDSELGEVYETTPAVTESRVVMDSEGNPTSEVEEVVITEAVDKKVSPAGVDQGKAVPILLAKIEQLERRLSAANL